MTDMSVEEAVKQLESLLSEGDDAGVWSETVELNEQDGKAIRIVLDRLKELEERKVKDG